MLFSNFQAMDLTTIFPLTMAISTTRVVITRGVDLHNISNCHSNTRADSTACLLYTSPSPRDRQKSRMPSSA